MSKWIYQTSRQKRSNNKKSSFRTTCPLCGRRLTLNGFDVHRKQNHKDLSHKEFELLVIEAIKSGKIEAQYFEGTSANPISGTQKTNKASIKDQGGLFHPSQGGRVSPK